MRFSKHHIVVILSILKAIKDRGPRYPESGICHNVREEILRKMGPLLESHSLIRAKEVAEVWLEQQFAGIPGLAKGLFPLGDGYEYHRAADVWCDEYPKGKARRELLDTLIQRATDQLAALETATDTEIPQ